MKIGIVTYRYLPIVGGAEAYLHDLRDLLDRAGHKVRIYQTETGEHGPEIYTVPAIPGPLPKLVTFNAALLKAIPGLAREKIVIISYPEHFPPLFWHPRGIVLSHGATWTHEKAGFRRSLRILSARWAYRKAAGYVLNDSFTFRELGVEFDPEGMAFHQVEDMRWYIPNCVDTDLFRWREGRPELMEWKPILVPRNFTYPRGIDLAIEAFAILSREEPDIHLVLVGGAIEDMAEPRKYEERLRGMVDRLALNEKVHFTGRFKRDEMPSVYSSSLLTLIPSRQSEGTSLAALESMACGTPAVTTDVEGLRDIPGVKCPPTIEGLLQGLKATLSRREELSVEQRREVENHFSRRRWDEAWLEVIEEVAKRGGK